MFARIPDLAPALALAVWLAAASGCSGPPRPDLERLYARQENPGGQPPVVLVHGLPGGRLAERGGGREIWPGSVARQTLDPTVERHRYSDFPLAYAFFLCESHDRLTGNIHFQDNLLHVLLSADDSP